MKKFEKLVATCLLLFREYTRRGVDCVSRVLFTDRGHRIFARRIGNSSETAYGKLGN